MSKLIRYGGPMSRTRRQGDPIGYSAPLGDSHFWFLQNNGSTVPPWTPSTPEWRVECYFYRQTRNTEAGGFEFIISNSANAAQNGLIVDSAAEAIKFRANHAGGTIILDQAAGGSIINTEYYVHGQFKALTNWLEVNGITAATNTTLTPIPVAYDKMGGDTNTTMIGSIWGLFLNDLAAPANSRWYPMNEGSGTQFLCYEADRITRKPAGDITIANATDTHWGARPVVQRTILIGLPASGDEDTPIPVGFGVARKTYAPDPSTYQWSILNPALTGTFSDPNIASPTFTPDSPGTYILRCEGKDMGGNALTAATVGLTSNAVPKRFVFDGPLAAETGNAIPAWLPSAVPYNVEYEIICDEALPPATAKLPISPTTGNLPSHTISTASKLVMRAVKQVDGTELGLTCGPLLSSGVLYTVRQEVTPTGQRGIVNGTPTPDSGEQAGPCKAPVNAFARMMGNSTVNAINGSMQKLFFEDVNNPANNRYYPMDEGAGTVFKCYSAPDMLTPLPLYDITITAAGQWVLV